MIGRHPTVQKWTPAQAILIAPAAAVLAFSLAAVILYAYAVEAVRDWRGREG